MGGRAWEDTMSSHENNCDNSPTAEDFDIRTLINYSTQSSPLFDKKETQRSEDDEDDFWPPKFLDPPKTVEPDPSQISTKQSGLKARPKTSVSFHRPSQDQKLSNLMISKCNLEPGNLSSSASSMLTIMDMDDEEIESRHGKRRHSAFSMGASSISWAEDAIESEFTEKLVSLWNEIEGVCAEGKPKPASMTDEVYQECLNWREAFPEHKPIRFRTSGTGTRRQSLQSHLAFMTVPTLKSLPSTPELSPPSNSPQPPLQDCLSPESTRRTSLYIRSWLAKCQSRRQTIDLVNENDPIEDEITPLRNCSTSEKNIETQPDEKPRKYSAASRDGDDEDDAAVYQTPPIGPKSISLKVQRPISSRLKGHGITPLPTSCNFRSRTVPNIGDTVAKKLEARQSIMETGESNTNHVLQRSKATLCSMEPTKMISEWPNTHEAEDLPTIGDTENKRGRFKKCYNNDNAPTIRPNSLNLDKDATTDKATNNNSKGGKPFFVWLMDRFSPN